MPLYSNDYLMQLGESKTFSVNASILNESKRVDATFDIFLSHSFLDRVAVIGIYRELTRLGFRVYVDWIIDPHLNREHVTKESAALIRTRMKNSASLLLAVSVNFHLSKWVPWELGFVDGKVGRCAIFPVSVERNQHVFRRAEYLLLYPYVKRANVGYTEGQYVTEAPNSYVSLTDWVKRRAEPTYQSTNIEVL